MSDSRIRIARPDDALVVAALALQGALDAGASPERGFLDRFARAWSAQHQSRPVWIAEHGSEHGGYLQAAILSDLPWPGERAGRGRLLVERVFVRPALRGQGIEASLSKAAAEFAAAEGLRLVEVQG